MKRMTHRLALPIFFAEIVCRRTNSGKNSAQEKAMCQGIENAQSPCTGQEET